MKELLFRIKKRWLRLMRTNQVELDGVILSTSNKDVPRFVQSLLFRGTYEESERKLIRSILGPSNRVLEIGTGIGFISILSKQICSDGQVRSYEANPKMEALIRSNYALNGLEPDLVMKAVTIDGGDIKFFVDQGVLSSSSIDRGRNDEETVVKSDKLDDIITDFRPDTIVMDVEGAEVDLLGKSKLHGVKQMIVELHPHIVGDADIASLKNALLKKGFVESEASNKVSLFSRHSG